MKIRVGRNMMPTVEEWAWNAAVAAEKWLHDTYGGEKCGVDALHGMAMRIEEAIRPEIDRLTEESEQNEPITESKLQAELDERVLEIIDSRPDEMTPEEALAAMKCSGEKHVYGFRRVTCQCGQETRTPMWKD